MVRQIEKEFEPIKMEIVEKFRLIGEKLMKKNKKNDVIITKYYWENNEIKRLQAKEFEGISLPEKIEENEVYLLVDNNWRKSSWKEKENKIMERTGDVYCIGFPEVKTSPKMENWLKTYGGETEPIEELKKRPAKKAEKAQDLSEAGTMPTNQTLEEIERIRRECELVSIPYREDDKVNLLNLNTWEKMNESGIKSYACHSKKDSYWCLGFNKEVKGFEARIDKVNKKVYLIQNDMLAWQKLESYVPAEQEKREKEEKENREKENKKKYKKALEILENLDKEIEKYLDNHLVLGSNSYISLVSDVLLQYDIFDNWKNIPYLKNEVEKAYNSIVFMGQVNFPKFDLKKITAYNKNVGYYYITEEQKEKLLPKYLSHSQILGMLDEDRVERKKEYIQNKLNNSKLTSYEKALLEYFLKLDVYTDRQGIYADYNFSYAKKEKIGDVYIFEFKFPESNESDDLNEKSDEKLGEKSFEDFLADLGELLK